MIESLRRFLGDMYFLTQARAVHELTRLPPDEKRRLLLSYADHYNVVVETGTYFGVTTASLATKYKQVYTIEIDKKLYETSTERLKGANNIACFHGDSSDILRKIVADLHEPAVFWLDAHYTGGITSKSDKNTPVLDELACIFAHEVKTHLILIDDARWFVGRNDYPSIRKLHAHVRESTPYDMIIHDDIIRIFRDDEWTRPETFLPATHP